MKDKPDCELCEFGWTANDDRDFRCELGMSGPAEECFYYSHFRDGSDHEEM